MKGHNYVAQKHHGIVTDHPPEEVPADRWTAGGNFQFQDKAAVRVSGYEDFAGPILGTGPLFAMNAIAGPDSLWIYCTANKAYATNGTTHADITPTEGLLTVTAGAWTGCVLNGIPVLNNGIDPPFFWDLNLNDPCEFLPGWPLGAYCQAIRAFKYHLFALNVFDGITNMPLSLIHI